MTYSTYQFTIIINKMLACMLPIEPSIVNINRAPLRFFNTEELAIYTNLNKTEIERILVKLLSKKCEMNVIGYNQYNDEYYCKKTKNNCEIMHFKIQLHSYGFNISAIKVKPVICNKINIKKFETALKSAIYDYEFEVQSSGDSCSDLTKDY